MIISDYKRLLTNITESKQLTYDSNFFPPTPLHRQSSIIRLALS